MAVVEVLILSSDQNSFLAQRALNSVLSQNIKPRCRIIENKRSVDREAAIRSSEADWLVLLDEDCYFDSPSALHKFICQSELHPEISIWGGRYQSESTASYSVRAYNELCNVWVQSSETFEKTGNLLGGCLALKVANVRDSLSANPIAWGGEDTYLIRQLQKKGFRTRQSPLLRVVHAPSSQTFSRIRRRALLHGKNRSEFQLQTTCYSSAVGLLLVRSIRFWPFWALHFLFLTLGSAIRKLDLPDTQIRLLDRILKRKLDPFRLYNLRLLRKRRLSVQ